MARDCSQLAILEEMWVEYIPDPPLDDTVDLRPATVADLVSALRAEGVLVVEKEGGVEIEIESVHPNSLECGGLPWRSLKAGRYLLVALDALAEAQPFPPAGG